MNRTMKTFAIVAAAGGVVYYFVHRHEAAASTALAQDITSGSGPVPDTAAMTDPSTVPNAGTPVYGTGAVGNGTPSAPNTQPVIRTITPVVTDPTLKRRVRIPGQTPPIIDLPGDGRMPISTTNSKITTHLEA